MNDNTPERIRVATLQYGMSALKDFSQFAEQVTGIVHTAAGQGCHLVVFPEYFSAQLIDESRRDHTIQEQLKYLATRIPEFERLFSELSAKYKLYIVAGTIPHVVDGELYNVSHIFGPDGKSETQVKLHLTQDESEDWGVRVGHGLRVFDTSIGRIAIAICYDVEFPELVRAAARAGAMVIVVPSCTESRYGLQRVRYCAAARAVENHIYVVIAATVGRLPHVREMHTHYGQAVVLSPSDFGFPQDAVLAGGTPNQPEIVSAELDMQKLFEVRNSGAVLPLRDSERTGAVVETVQVVKL